MMYLSDFSSEEQEKEMEKSSEFILKKTNLYIEELQKKLQENLFSKISKDIEEWIYERYDNVRRQYFDGIVAFLLGIETTSIKDKYSLEKYLSDIGYNPLSFRKKIYQDNKDVIIKAIDGDAAYDRLKVMFKGSYWRYWNFDDLSKGYPQSDIVNGFLEFLMSKKGFKEVISSKLNVKIKDLIRQKLDLEHQIELLEEELNQ